MMMSNNVHDDQLSDQKKLDLIRTQLFSDNDFEINKGMSQLQAWLISEPENPALYDFMEALAHEKPALQDIIEDLLDELIRAGSKLARQTLPNIFSSSITIEADDAYYAGEINKAIKLYSQILQVDSENKRARKQLEKIWAKDSSESLPTQIPRDAVQYYRLARSYIAVGDNKSAIAFLGAAVDEAAKAKVQFIEAATLLGRLQDLESAAEYKLQAENHLREDRWMDALDSYNKAALLEASGTPLSNLIAGLTELIKVNEAIESLEQNPDALERKLNEWRKSGEISRIMDKAGETTLVTTSLYRRIVRFYVNGLSTQLSDLLVKVNSKTTADSSDLVKGLRELMYTVLTDLPDEDKSEAYKKLRGLFDESGNFVASENLAMLVVQEINASLESARRRRVRTTFPWFFTAITLVILVVGVTATVLRVVPSFHAAVSGDYFYLILGCLALIGSWARSAKELISLESINGNKSFELLMLKPFVGSSLASIVLLAIRSGLLEIDVELSAFLYWAVSILVGYTQPAVDFILGALNKNWITSVNN